MFEGIFDIAKSTGPGTGGRMDQPIGGKRRHLEHLDKLKSLYEFDWLKKTLGQATPLKGDYRFGKQGNVRVQHNLKDELINAITEKLFFNRYEEINPSIGFGGQFGKDKKWDWGGQLQLNKQGQLGNFGVNIGRSF